MDRTNRPLKLAEARVLSSQSLAGENFPGRPNQVAIKSAAGGLLDTPIMIFQGSIVTGYVKA